MWFFNYAGCLTCSALRRAFAEGLPTILNSQKGYFVYFYLFGYFRVE
jgi:hypothetical protein